MINRYVVFNYLTKVKKTQYILRSFNQKFNSIIVVLFLFYMRNLILSDLCQLEKIIKLALIKCKKIVQN